MDPHTVIYGAAIATNALFTNLAPKIYAEVQRWRMPLVCPFNPDDLKRFSFDANDENYCVQLRSGWLIDLNYGVLVSFYGPDYPDSKYHPEPGATAHIGPEEALRIATNYVAIAGLPERLTWINLKPKITPAALPDTPYFLIQWFRPNWQDDTTVEIAVDCRNGRIDCMNLFCLYGDLLSKHRKRGPPLSQQSNTPRLPSAVVQRDMPRLIARNLAPWRATVPFPKELLEAQTVATNITRWIWSGWTGVAEHWLTLVRFNGWELDFRDGYLLGWQAPDRFFQTEIPPDIGSFTGRWRLSEAQAIDLVRESIRHFQFSHDGLKAILRRPEVLKPNIRPPPTVPRYQFEWISAKPWSDSYGVLDSLIRAEVDADHKRVVSLKVYLRDEGADLWLTK